MRLFTSLKSLTTRTVLSFLGMMNVGDDHSESSCHLSTPKSHSLCTSLFVISMCFLGMGKGLPWYGCAPSFNWRETGLQSQSPSFPLNNSSNSCRSSSNLACSGPLRCVQLSLTIALRSDFSYLVSSIFYEAICCLQSALWFLGCFLVDAIIHSPSFFHSGSCL